MDVREVPLGQLTVTRNVRLQMGDLTELAESIREHGVLQPIRVRPVDGGRFQVIAGHRRAAAARMVGLASIPAVVVEESDSGVAVQNVVENLQRENLSPLELVRGVRELRQSFGFSVEEIARALSKSPARVRTLLRAGLLPDEVLAKLESGESGTQDVRGLTLRHVEPLLAGVPLGPDGALPTGQEGRTAIEAAKALVDEVERRGVRINAHMADAVARRLREGEMTVEEAVDRVLAAPELYRYGAGGQLSALELEADTWAAYRGIQRTVASLIFKLRPEIAAMFEEHERRDLLEGAEAAWVKLGRYLQALEGSNNWEGSARSPRTRRALPAGRDV
jgi:ParB/RepB/Spo0J family partition protein